ncbi:MAG: hypothetical protein DME17_01865 [Candidatus Rokuibacteriota bacterium]|nr:MAG: hypothetical protein DME17_01865 [Candidatus Rokubacteria bacterium]
MKKILSVLPLVARLASLPVAGQQTNPVRTYQTDPSTGAPVLDANGNPIPTTCTPNFVVGALDTNSAAPTFEIASQDGVGDPPPNNGLLLVGPSMSLNLPSDPSQPASAPRSPSKLVAGSARAGDGPR